MARILETERLILRTWEREDVDTIFKIYSTDIDHAETHRVLEKIGFTRRGIEKIHIDEDLVFEIKNQSETV